LRTLCAALAVCLAGCASGPQVFERRASSIGLQRQEVPGLAFRHVVYRRQDLTGAGQTLHVYLEGDGTPYVRRDLASADPTPRDPVALTLMPRDPAPALLLGRPCYHGLAASPGCTKALWTGARYGEAVVASMAVALRRLAPGDRPLVLIGFSGGGTLAVLLAQRLPQVVAVVTLGGNLDIERWADGHGYGRLQDSLNPVEGPRPASRVVQMHYAGSLDSEVPPALITDAARRLGGESFVLEGVSHADGWDRHWAAILERLDQRLPRTGSPPGGRP
jgi:pimeloyl-ACP methyl ester carboxylesterase